MKESDIKRVWRSLEIMADNLKEREWMTTTEATAFLRVSTKTMTRLIRERVIATHSHPLDRRKKLVRVADVVQLKKQAEILAA